MKSTRSLFSFALAAAGLVLGQFAAAQADSYPSRSIRLVVPFPAASATDIATRIIAQEINKSTGQSVVVENIPGANGFIAIQSVLSAPADGYTALVGTNTTNAANAALFKKLPYDPLTSFAPISILGDVCSVVVVVPTSPHKTIAEFLDAVRKRDKELSFASGNSSSQVAAEMIRQRTNARMLHVPYQGTPQAITDLLGGQVDFMVSDVNTAVQMIQSGKLRGLAVTSSRRDPLLPELPTLAEAGLQGYELISWSGVFVAANTPAPVVTRLHKLVADAVASEAFKSQMTKTGATAKSSSSPAEFLAFVRSETAKWKKAVADAGIEQQ